MGISIHRGADGPTDRDGPAARRLPRPLPWGDHRADRRACAPLGVGGGMAQHGLLPILAPPVRCLAVAGRADQCGGLILLLPLVITRGATLVSLLVIEAGAYMPEVNQQGVPGDASASFVAFTAIFFLIFALVFRRCERWFLAYAARPCSIRSWRGSAGRWWACARRWGHLPFCMGCRAGFRCSRVSTGSSIGGNIAAAWS